MRDWTRIDGYLNAITGDVYPQPEDEGHSELSKSVIDTWMSRLTGCKTVLDVGCGEGFCQPFFEEWGVEYEGVCLGEDYLRAKEKGRNVKKMDFSFLEYGENSFDMIFSRHSLEHSPMPLFTLMEWNYVSKQWLGLILPAPEWYTYKGLNHYSVLSLEQVEPLLDRAGWKVIWSEIGYWKKEQGMKPEVHEYWIFSEKKR